jgi:DNA helicase-2/ATP-dependent DNA helicase PcrA
VLVLTHTNAGVSALRKRFQSLSVPAARYRVATIDGFCLNLVSKFQRRSGVAAATLLLNNTKADYPAIRQAAIRLIQGKHLDDALTATYGRLVVDEYQDCSIPQHTIVDGMADVLPTCVLGDPMQAIFGFTEPLVDWTQDVHGRFPPVGELDVPWRWVNAKTEELGKWLLSVRRALQDGGSIDLREAPNHVELIILRPADAAAQRISASRAKPVTKDGAVMILGDSINVAGRHQIASQTPGATCVESVDLKDLMTNVGQAETLRRLASLRGGKARNPASAVEAALLSFGADPTLRNAHSALVQMREHHNVRVYRPEILHRCLSAMEAAADGSCTFYEATVRERERFRHRGRPMRSRNVGSTLLLKGLEAEVVVIIHPELMDARHLYVALTRGSHRTVVCSAGPVLTPIK